MKALATYVMRGRIQATILATVFAAMSLLLPPFSYLSGAIVALVSLRKGPIEGLLVSLIAAAAIAAVSVFTLGHVVVAVAYLLVVWLPVWLLALVLRKTVSMPLALTVAGILGVVAVLAVYSVVPEPVSWWRSILEQFFSQAMTQSDLPEGVSGIDEVLDATAKMMTGLMASAFVVSVLFSLLIARWWQAMLYNPGGFRDEFIGLRLDKATSVITVVVIAAAFAMGGAGSIAADLAAVILTISSIPGLALLHSWAAIGKGRMVWLFVVYVMLLFAMPQMMTALAIVAVADSWIDIRRYLNANKQT